MKKLIIILLSISLNSCDFTTAEDYNNQAVELSQKGKYNEAIILLDKAIKKKNNFRPALLNRASYKESIGDLSGAIKDFEMVIEFDSDNTLALCELAYNWSSLKNHKKAIIYYNKALKTEGAVFTSLSSDGEKFAINSNIEFKSFDDNADYNILDCIIYYNRGIEYFELKEYNNAISDFKKSLKVNNMVSNSYYYLGEAYLGLNDSLESCENFSKSAQLGDIQARKMLEKNCINMRKIKN